LTSSPFLACFKLPSAKPVAIIPPDYSGVKGNAGFSFVDELLIPKSLAMFPRRKSCSGGTVLGVAMKIILGNILINLTLAVLFVILNSWALQNQLEETFITLAMFYGALVVVFNASWLWAFKRKLNF
jgi:hypothetical protein